MKKVVSLLLAVILAAGMLTACQTAKETEAPPAGTQPAASNQDQPAPGPTHQHPGANIVAHAGSDTESIDPAVNASVDGMNYIQHMFEGLYRLDKDGIPEPAQAYKYDISADLTVYTFHLRDDIFYTDGKAVTANDFEWALKHACEPATGGHYDYMMDCIKGYAMVEETGDGSHLAVTALDEKTLRIELNTPVAYFLELVAFPTYMPVRQDIYEKYGDAWATKPETYISNGAFKLTEFVPGSHLKMVKNNDYWEANTIGPASVEFRLIEDLSASTVAYEAGELVYAQAPPASEVPRLLESGDLIIGPQLGTYYADINNSINDYANATDAVKEFLGNPLVRQALCISIDRQYIIDKIAQGNQIAAGRFIGPGFNDATAGVEFADAGDYYDPYDVEGNRAKAKELLAEAGYGPGGKAIPTIEYMYNTSVNHQLIGEALQHDWAEIGVPCTLTNQEWSVFLVTRPNGEYETARDGWLADYNDPMTMLDMFVTGGGNNNCKLSNEKYDALIKAAKVETDRNKYYQLLHDAEDILIGEEWALIPIYFYTQMYLASPSLQGMYRTPLGGLYFHYAYLN